LSKEAVSLEIIVETLKAGNTVKVLMKFDSNAQSFESKEIIA